MVLDAVLHALEAQRGNYVNGEALAQSLGVSRAAIWKAIEKLRASGLQIDALSGEGYRLSVTDDTLTTQAVQAGLTTQIYGRKLIVMPQVESTNTLVKQQYAAEPNGFTLIAETQTAGRGRLGRSFISPAGEGLYMSVLLRARIPLAQLHFITLAAAVAVCRAIHDTAGFLPTIKWVNDVWMHDKKLCGILTEASIEGESGLIDYVVLGIGINLRLSRQTLPPTLQDIACSLADFSQQVPRRAVLASSVLNHVESLCSLIEEGNIAPLIAAYRHGLGMLGRRVQVITPRETYDAIAQDIDENGHLLVRLADGTCQTLQAGEIRILPLF